jgi:hypothetical protein
LNPAAVVRSCLRRSVGELCGLSPERSAPHCALPPSIAREVWLGHATPGLAGTADEHAATTHGVFAAAIDPGRDRCRFVVDEEWQNGPLKPEVEPAPFGGHNAAIVVRARHAGGARIQERGHPWPTWN